MKPCHIRDERDGDAAAITDVIEQAFRTMPYSDHTEQFVVAALRRAGALSVSLVAELDQRIVGHVAFSPVAVADGTPECFGLGPVSVIPELQRRGIGAALIERGLARLRAQGANACVVLGWPDYYARFGFRPESCCVLPGFDTAHFQVLVFRGAVPRGSVTYHGAFASKG